MYIPISSSFLSPHLPFSLVSNRTSRNRRVAQDRLLIFRQRERAWGSPSRALERNREGVDRTTFRSSDRSSRSNLSAVSPGTKESGSSRRSRPLSACDGDPGCKTTCKARGRDATCQPGRGFAAAAATVPNLPGKSIGPAVPERTADYTSRR